MPGLCIPLPLPARWQTAARLIALTMLPGLLSLLGALYVQRIPSPPGAVLSILPQVDYEVGRCSDGRHTHPAGVVLALTYSQSVNAPMEQVTAWYETQGWRFINGPVEAGLQLRPIMPPGHRFWLNTSVEPDAVPYSYGPFETRILNRYQLFLCPPTVLLE